MHHKHLKQRQLAERVDEMVSLEPLKYGQIKHLHDSHNSEEPQHSQKSNWKHKAVGVLDMVEGDVTCSQGLDNISTNQVG